MPRYYSRPGRVYSYSPYGYPTAGFGYLYYDSYGWTPRVYAGAVGTYYSAPRTFDFGELRIDVSPRDAQVFVDGYYAGIVDDFDGTFQAVKLTEGEHRIEILLPGYDAVSFDVLIARGQKMTYRGELNRLP